MRFYDIAIQRNEELISLGLLVYSLNTLKEENFSDINFTVQSSLEIFPFISTTLKGSKYGVFSGLYFPVFGLNTGILNGITFISKYRLRFFNI